MNPPNFRWHYDHYTQNRGHNKGYDERCSVCSYDLLYDLGYRFGIRSNHIVNDKFVFVMLGLGFRHTYNPIFPAFEDLWIKGY